MTDDNTLETVLEQLSDTSAGNVTGVTFKLKRRGPGGTGDETEMKVPFYREDPDEFKAEVSGHLEAMLALFDRVAAHRHPLVEDEA